MANRVFKYLRPEDILSLESFEFAPKLFVEGFLAGRHRSHVRGVSTEFQDYRQYAHGDDLRLVDWKTYARTDRHYVRVFEQETDLSCYVLLDSSASMGYGSSLSKLEYSSFFVAGLAWLMVHNRDHISLVTFDEQLQSFFPPANTWKHLTGVLNQLESSTPGNETSLSTTLKTAFPLFKRKGTVVIISDFMDDAAEIFSALNMYIHRGFDIKMFHILTPQELELEKKGLVSFADPEDGSRITAHTENLRSGYTAMVKEHIGTLRELANRRQIDYHVIRTDQHHYRMFELFMGGTSRI